MIILARLNSTDCFCDAEHAVIVLCQVDLDNVRWLQENIFRKGILREAAKTASPDIAQELIEFPNVIKSINIDMFSIMTALNSITPELENKLVDRDFVVITDDEYIQAMQCDVARTEMDFIEVFDDSYTFSAYLKFSGTQVTTNLMTALSLEDFENDCI
jgi:hypothetical protein